MSTICEKLIGKAVRSVDWCNDNWGIVFSDGSGLTCYSAFEVRFSCDSEDTHVVSCNCDAEFLHLVLGNGTHVKIGAVPEARSPEAFVYNDSDGTTIVAN